MCVEFGYTVCIEGDIRVERRTNSVGGMGGGAMLLFFMVVVRLSASIGGVMERQSCVRVCVRVCVCVCVFCACVLRLAAMLARACLSVVAILVDVLPPRVPGTGCLVPPAVSILLCRRSSAFYATVLFHDIFRVSVIFCAASKEAGHVVGAARRVAGRAGAAVGASDRQDGGR